MKTSEIFEQLKTVKDPQILAEVHKELEILWSLKNQQLNHFKKIIDDREKEKQMLLSKKIETSHHRITHSFLGFGREESKIKDRLRRKTEKQLTMQTKGLGVNEKSFKKANLPKGALEHLLSEEQTAEIIVESGLRVKETDLVECDQIRDLYEESCEITVTERTFTKVVHKRAKYKAKNLMTGEEKIITAPGAVKLYPKCQFSIDFALMCVGDKFLNHLPYERQRREIKRSGLDVPVSTMCRLERGVSTHLEEVSKKILSDIKGVKHLAVGLDETRWPILNKTDSNGYFWTVCNAAGSYYRFEPSRSGKVARELLEGFKGAAISDKFKGYEQFLDQTKLKNKGIDWAFCLAHARRDFISLQKSYPKDCTEVLDLMDEVFALEHKAKTYADLEEIRKTESTPLMDELKELLQEKQIKFFKSDDMAVAINYLLSNWTEFTKFLTDTRLPLSNNESERAMRQAVLGRKNYHGSKTVDGADQAAIMFTVVETCKKAELDPKDYIKYVITENHYGREPLTPLQFVLKERGKSDAWPEMQAQQITQNSN